MAEVRLRRRQQRVSSKGLTRAQFAAAQPMTRFGSIVLLLISLGLLIVLPTLAQLQVRDDFMLRRPIRLAGCTNFLAVVAMVAVIEVTLCLYQTLLRASQVVQAYPDLVAAASAGSNAAKHAEMDAAGEHPAVTEARRTSAIEWLQWAVVWCMGTFAIFATSGAFGDEEQARVYDANFVFSLAMTQLAFAFAIVVTRNLRITTVRRELGNTPQYIRHRVPTLMGVLVYQCLVMLHVALIAYSSSPYISIVSRGGMLAWVPEATRSLACPLVNTSYVAEYCDVAWDQAPYAEPFGSPFYKCAEAGGTWGAYYNSVFAACRAALMYEGFEAKIYSAMVTMLCTVGALIFYEYVIGVDETLSWQDWYRQTSSPRMRFAIFCAFLGAACILLLTLILILPGAGVRVFALRLNLATGIIWGAAHCTLTIEFAVSYVQKQPDILLDFEGKQRSIKQVLETLVARELAQQQRAGADAAHDGALAKFASDPSQLISGLPVEAALGVNHYMRTHAAFAMPALGDGIEAIVREFEAHGTETDRECLHYVRSMRAGESEVVFDNGQLKRDCDASGSLLPARRRSADGLGMALQDFIDHPHSKTAGLSPPHVLALRVYTTAAYRSLNAPLRDASKERAPHSFPVTINYIKEGIGQLRAVEAASGDQGTVALWRGMRDLRTSSTFERHGGTELAPMSTTLDVRIAVQYSLSASSLLFKLKTTSFMQRGADLSYLSAFPAESEVLYPPLTFLRPTGQMCTARIDVDGGTLSFKVVEVEPIFPS